jgi:Ni,Fe-hydrogenase III large subunit
MTPLTVRNSMPFALGDVPRLGIDAARALALQRRDAGERLAALFGAADGASVRIHAATAADHSGLLRLFAFDVPRAAGGWPSWSGAWPEAHLFEREIAEQFGLRPEGHPWLKPVRGERPLDGPELFPPPPDARCRLDAYPFLRADGEEMHEVGVGPVHAGIIEPGHFRFLCHGERVESLEISLGYQHRGVERRLAGGPDRRTMVTVEAIAGDTVIGHALAHCQALEGLAGARVGARALAVRALALELERCSNHVGDLGALANDVGYLPGSAWFGRIRGEFLNSLMDLSGNRYGRGLLLPGGVRFDVDAAMRDELRGRVLGAGVEIARIAAMMLSKPSVMARFDGVGIVRREIAEDLGMVGPAARASGCGRDVRRDFAHGAWAFHHIPVAIAETGDVAGRALVRSLETQRSIEFLAEQLDQLPGGELRQPIAALAPDSGCIAMVEGWRGEILHAVLTGAGGRIARYKVVDPSFHNWTGLAIALRGEEISDFPLCNKSFNLSYAGHDL